MEGTGTFQGVYMPQNDGTTGSIPVRVLNNANGRRKVNDKWNERCGGDAYEGQGYLFCR